jgi:hypothetical protein
VLVREAVAPADARPANGSQALGQNGTDDPNALVVADYQGGLLPGTSRSEVQGLAALEPYGEVALVYAPAVAADIARAIIAHCERVRYRFAVIDCEPGAASSSLDPRTQIVDSQYAAFYYPWLVIADPQTGGQQTVPPGGHVLGVYSRTDIERGVFKAPANEALQGVIGLEVETNDAMQDVLNARSVNVIRRFPGRGILVWGARTMTTDSEWKYVNVRRLLIFLERSIDVGTQWAVFEPNDRSSWKLVTEEVEHFLRDQWRLGALFGATEDKAFFIRCDETTMTQSDIDTGRLIYEIGVAPLRPAEFVVFRILHAR